MLEKQSKENVLDIAKRFEISAPITEKEFDDILDDVALSLLFGTKWEDPLLLDKKKRRKIPIVNDLPLICAANDCVFAPKCPVLKGMKEEDKIKLINTECRDEKLYVVEQFAEWVRELDLSPEATSDILGVASVIRVLVYIRRTDRHIAVLKSLFEKKVMIDQKGHLVTDKENNQMYSYEVSQLNKLHESYNKQLAVLQTQLMASRKDKAQFAAASGAHMETLQKLLTQKFNREESVEAEYKEVDDDDDI